ncbi:LysR family transcriptional regulator [Hyalangium rubrum]|uniref:LysR family transcriptional regulator n=1 Tax=Hyalangium rubrum TaxID=3103134 RepID=A0ABU5H7U6_9BACT|nr:LysR family transcriptional regulator [Hyalangium sp. s54d21]MDY7229336.1 LysR family transcriptional regulator [Hyalangium sp. s54d21]
MPDIYGRTLDLNLLRVFAVVAENRSVTQAASRLYLTQPAVSAALRRLTTAVGAPLFVRQGRGLVLTARGERLLASIHPHLQSLVDAALAPPSFDPRTSDRTLRLGLSDATEVWLLPPLLRVLEREAPRMRVISLPVQFRNVAAVLASASIDAAITVADELPASIHRQTLYWGGFVCLFDPRHARLKRTIRESDYFAHEHVIVSYNGDLRGVVEDALQKSRRVRCSVSSFANLGAIIDGSALLATVPLLVAQQILAVRPHLRTAPLPFELGGAPMELLWPAAVDDDEACRFLRSRIARIVEEMPVSGTRPSEEKRLGRGADKTRPQ